MAFVKNNQWQFFNITVTWRQFNHLGLKEADQTTGGGGGKQKKTKKKKPKSYKRSKEALNSSDIDLGI